MILPHPDASARSATRRAPNLYGKARALLCLPLALAAIALRAVSTEPEIRVSETTLFGDLDCFKIETPHATYLYGKVGAGLASIIDRDGHDWISYRHGGKSAGEYHNTRQLHRGRQLEEWNARGWFTPRLRDEDFPKLPRLASLDDDTASLDLRVRSYLDANCSACHRPGGPSRGLFDARISTPLDEQKLLNGDLMAGDLGVAGARVILPGQPEKSVMYLRLQRNDAFRMPQVSVNDEPQPILPAMEAWIRSLSPTH